MPHASRGLVVVVDGPSGSGKSSAARQVASRLGLRYLDTGAMYRAVTWWMLSQGVDVEDEDQVAAAVEQVHVDVTTDAAAVTVCVNGTDVTELIRHRDVSNAVSAVSAVPAVRARLLTTQREVLGPGGVVAEGRDLGSVVAPDADVKVYLTADSAARAKRRQAELDDDTSVDLTHDEILARDRLDSARELSPLTKADDAVEIDSTAMSLPDVVEAILALVAVGSSRDSGAGGTAG